VIDRTLAPITTALGVLGMPGHTAWYGLTRLVEACAGETIVVSAATGAVGSLVAQLARLRGMRVIGVAGGAAKCRYAVEVLGCAACLDHRAAPTAAALEAEIAAAAPEGIDVYYENVGGKTLEAVLPRMNRGGRIVVCGCASWLSGVPAGETILLEPAWWTIVGSRLTVRGFVIDDHPETLPAFLAEVSPLVADGRVVYHETVAEGLASAPEALAQVLRGGNLGKQLVRIAAG
jgi:NADPH-dependent curcumin reductase CurA